MIDRSEPHPITTVQSLPEWESILEEIELAGYFGLNIVATGPDPLSHKIQRIFLALPNAPSNSSVYMADIADRPELKERVLGDLAGCWRTGGSRRFCTTRNPCSLLSGQGLVES